MTEAVNFPSTQWTALHLAAHGTEAERMRNRTAQVDRYRPAVTKAAARLNWLHGDYEDAVEEVLHAITAPNLLRRLNPAGSFRGLVSRVLQNHWREHWRRELSPKRDRTLSVALEVETLGLPVTEPDFAAVVDEEVALECLEEARRTLFAKWGESEFLAALWDHALGIESRPLEEFVRQFGAPSTNAVSQKLRCLRRELREHFRSAVVAVVYDPADLPAEALYLWKLAQSAALRRGRDSQA
jgi:DNA-directed RNA polymerase specialized sigma24 family protein